ncbi:hypothetical protein F5884DRAFT_757583 [Xylogone sp. PMI_703]|nr:hypothetical protein F5884DRAFT_757583 [Xylogone sp. PMI_703]
MNPDIKNIPLYGVDGQPHEFDVHQLLTPDCWLEATLAAIVRVDPSRITQILHDNGDGTVTVSLYDPLTLIAITPPPQVKKKSFEQTIQDKDSQTIWVQVIQDALSPFVNGTVFNGKGQNPVLALSAIYGQPAIDSICDQLSNLAEKATAYPIILSTQDNIKGPLVEDHAYTVENIVQVDGSAGVTMRNPWGMVNEDAWGIETSKGVKNRGHGEFDIANEKVLVQCAGIEHLQNM